MYLYRLQELEWDDESQKITPSGLTLDLPLALAEVYRRQGYIDESLQWFMQTIEWSWSYKGHGPVRSRMQTMFHKRLAKMLMALPTSERRAHIARLQEWFQQKRLTIPLTTNGKEEKQFTLWFQTLEVGP